MTVQDLATVDRIAGIVHPDFPESSAVFAERLALFPQGCWRVEAGYAFAHPTRLGNPPMLDTLLGGLPADADALHLHDVALLPEARGQGLGGALLATLDDVAREAGLVRLALVAVHGTTPYWARYGFAAIARPELVARSYGADAAYMARAVR